MLSMRQKNAKTASGTAFALCAALVLIAGCGSVPAGKQTAAERGAAIAHRAEAVDFAGKTLLLVGFLHDGTFIPLEPGHGSSANIIFSGDGTVSGYSGFRDFSGTWKSGKTGANGMRNCNIAIAAPKNGTSAAGHTAVDAIAARFEKDFFAALAATTKLQKEKDFIMLLGSRDEVLLRFMFAESLTQD